MATNKTLIFIPTYNESKNVEVIFNQINELKLNVDILFLDDNSPDGTGDIIDRLVERNPTVHVVHRLGKLGIGSAHLDGVRWTYENHYKTLITMDCDFSHSPRYLSDFIKYSSDYDVVIGSRYIEQGSLKGWNWFRKSLTYIVHFLTNTILKMPYDATGAFRLYRLEKIPMGVFDLVHSRKYSFFFESLYVLQLNGCSIKEFPIHLPARTYGHSKMTFKEMIHGAIHLIHIYLKTLINKESFLYSEPFVLNGVLDATRVQSEWNTYWLTKKDAGSLIYDLIAAFYRKFIIKRTLNYFVKKHFDRGSEVLHAGCGSGQVDTDISNRVNISALDISIPALSIYKKIHKDSCKIIRGSIFKIPVKDETFDGIYNLGVMEHFTKPEIQKILQEFDRVLKPNGRMIIFWPPEFGLSVIFLKIVHYIFNYLFKRNIKLHPDEITRVRSKKQAKAIFAKANFTIVEYYFGIRDFFTYSIIVLSKDSPNNGNSMAIFPCPICGSSRFKVLYPDTLKGALPCFGYNFSPAHNLTYRIVLCRDCEHAYSSPRPVSLGQNYQSFEDPVYLADWEQRVATARKVVKRLRRHLSSGRLLDIGCSTGDFLSVAQEFYQVEGLELSSWGANIARSRGFIVHDCELGRMQTELPYDLVTIWGVIEHFEFPSREVANISRLVREGSLVCLWTGDVKSLPSRLLGKKWWYIQGQHIQLFSRRSLRKVFNDNGFDEVRIELYPYVMTWRSISQSLNRYPLIGMVAKYIFNLPLLSNRTITLLMPGEMFAIFRKR